jgi:hypothetical protein
MKQQHDRTDFHPSSRATRVHTASPSHQFVIERTNQRYVTQRYRRRTLAVDLLLAINVRVIALARAIVLTTMHRYHDGTYTRDVLISEGKTGKIDKFMVILLFRHIVWLKPRTPINLAGRIILLLEATRTRHTIGSSVNSKRYQKKNKYVTSKTCFVIHKRHFTPLTTRTPSAPF